ncbi:Glycosyl transferase family 2 [Porphyromonadaceae bacterium KH3CP3RA]|nr:Glycosyl transferase family 2 [Porphyromonadaceae bacterium KH3CP3RA]
MKISVITVVLNGAATIRETIESVLAQDYHDIEHIIVDGDSKDNTMDIVGCYGNKIAHVISEPDKGIYDAMNKGIETSTGEVIGFLNADDFFATYDVISRIVAEFTIDSSIKGVYSNLFYVKRDNPNSILRHWISSPFKQNSFFKGWHPPHPTLYLKKEVYAQYGLFTPTLPLAADFELMLRLFEKYKIKTKYIDYTSVKMRSGGATNKNWKNIRQQNLECMKAFALNGFAPPRFYVVYRLIPKLLQYIKR